ncbi:MAG: hypothetical protein ACERKD_16230 [Prolixibacteraceae bacterium]
MELSKKDKKAAREIIEKGLQQEFGNGLTEFLAILNKWKENETDNRETYHHIYKSISSFDKHIARRYDGITGSKYLFIIAGQLNEKVISENDLELFSDDVKNAVKLIAGLD